MSERDRVLFLMGQETTRGRLFTGLYLLLGGFFIGIVALVFFFISGAQQPGSGAYYGWREAALACGAVAVTTFFAGVSTALPSRKAMRITAGIGLALCGVAVFLFVLHYPMNFNVQDSPDPAQKDYTSLDTIVFASGLVLVVAGAFVSVIGHWVQSLAGHGNVEGDDEWTGKGYEVPDWVVEQDIDDAMKRHGVSWGLGEKEDVVHIEAAGFDEDNIVIGGKGKVKTVRLSGNRIDKAMENLQATRPDYARTKALPGDWTDDAVARLRAFQKEKQEHPEEYTPKLGFWARLLRRRSRLTPVEKDLEDAQEGLVTGGTGGAKTVVIEDDEA